MKLHPKPRAIVLVGIALLTAILFLVSRNAEADDAALRAFFGIRSLRTDLPVVQEDRYFAVAVGQFEDGKFVRYALPPQMGLSTAHTSGRFVEFAWHGRGEKTDCVLVADGINRAIGPDDFVSKFEGRTQEVSGSSEGIGQFRGFRVVSFLAAVPAGADERAPLHFEQSIKELPTIALLYQEFSKRSEYLSFLEELEKAP